MNNVALITGASSGIGRELAHLHAERGGDLVVVARREEKLRALKETLEETHGVQVVVVAQDLSDPNAAQTLYDAVQEAGIEVSMLINNAGFGGRGLFHERDWDEDRAMIQVNIVALTALCRLFLPRFIAQGHGRILNVSSTASLTPGPLQAVYFATKAFVTFLSNALAEELKGTGVTVTALLPGATETEFAETADMSDSALFEQAASARSVALDGYEAMMAGDLEVITGVTFTQRLMLAGLPFTPKSVRLSQIRKMQQG